MADPTANPPRRFQGEDPRRIADFRARTEGLRWEAEHLEDSLRTLFAAVDALAEAEIAYYHRRRGTRAWISGLTRLAAWVLGSIGLLLPLLAGTASPLWQEWGQYGYVFLAGAASALAANSLFAGTEGHIRFVSTQLELERLVVASRVEWYRYLALPRESPEDVARGFSLILDYAQHLHGAVLQETGRWGETLLAELSKLERKMNGGGGA